MIERPAETWLQKPGFLGADHDHVLAETCFQFVPVRPPPTRIELRCHDFEDDNIVATGVIMVLFPVTFRVRAGVDRKPAEPLR